MKKVIKFFAAFVLALGVLVSCNNEKEETTAGLAKVKVSLVDAPADYEAVMIDVKDIQVNVSEEDKGWKSLNGAKPGVYDILKLTNGKEAFMGEIELPQGKLSQIRLILGDNNKLKVGGKEINLKVPSGFQSGLKIKVGADISSGVTYKLVIDFDAAKSVVKSGNSGKYNLKPVIRAQMEAKTGAIKGKVEPKEATSVVYAISSSNDSISSYPDASGEFLIRALPAGTYKVVATPKDATTYNEAMVDAVKVEVGKQKAIDALTLTKKSVPKK